MLPGRFRFVTAPSDKGADDLQRDHGIIGGEPLGEKPVEDTEGPRLVVVAIAGGTLAVEKPVQRRRQR
jgi:hypothetical protein